MPQYEYRVVPAPRKGRKAKGVKSNEARFALALQDLMKELGRDGWEYQRADMLPSQERAGLTSSTTEWRNLLVFRRLRENDAESFKPELLPAPEEAAPEPAARKEPTVKKADKAARKADAEVQKPKETKPEASAEPANGEAAITAEKTQKDDGEQPAKTEA
ncbi:MAG: DUF4177 domain-containing protein [Sulfitobacter sp.]|nr:DUF4177 domain-containing protein [Sulfitobacter sp.]